MYKFNVGDKVYNVNGCACGSCNVSSNTILVVDSMELDLVNLNYQIDGENRQRQTSFYEWELSLATPLINEAKLKKALEIE